MNKFNRSGSQSSLFSRDYEFMDELLQFQQNKATRGGTSNGGFRENGILEAKKGCKQGYYNVQLAEDLMQNSKQLQPERSMENLGIRVLPQAFEGKRKPSSLKRRNKVKKKPSFGSTFVEITPTSPSNTNCDIARENPAYVGCDFDNYCDSSSFYKQSNRFSSSLYDLTSTPKGQTDFLDAFGDGTGSQRSAPTPSISRNGSSSSSNRRIPIRDSGTYNYSAENAIDVDSISSSTTNNAMLTAESAWVDRYRDPARNYQFYSPSSNLSNFESIDRRKVKKKQQDKVVIKSILKKKVPEKITEATIDIDEVSNSAHGTGDIQLRRPSLHTMHIAEEQLDSKMKRYFSYDNLNEIASLYQPEEDHHPQFAQEFDCKHKKEPSNADSGFASEQGQPVFNDIASSMLPSEQFIHEATVMQDMQQHQEDGTIYIRISVPETNEQKCLTFNISDSVHVAKMHILRHMGRGLKDPWNFGLYCPPMNQKAGKFLQEERTLKEYPLPGPIGFLEFKYKRRIYKSIGVNANKLKKLHSRSNLKQFIEYVKQGDVQKISKWVNKGIDPNFHCKDTGETPLTLAVNLQKPRELMMALYSGGAHLDFRDSKYSMTPMHKAATGDSLEAVKTLLDLGQSPNCIDPKGLTPLYLTMLHETRSALAERFLFDHSIVGTADDQGLQEIHQACKFGKLQHLDHLVTYGAELDAVTKNGNTPLHICAFMGQVECAKLLLFRGCDRTLRNSNDQTAYQVALVSSHENVAEIIKSFSTTEVVPVKELPRFNEGRRSSIPTIRNQRWGSLSHINQLARMDMNGEINGSSSFDHHSATMSHSSGMRVSQIHSNSRPSPNLYNGHSKSASNLANNQWNNMQGDARIANGYVGIPNSLQSIVHPDELSHFDRVVVLQKGSGGFGFVLRGAKAGKNADPRSQLSEFRPTMSIPGLQYLEDVEKGSPSWLAGLRRGDYIIEINNETVTTASHERCVQLIRQSGGTLTLKVVTVSKKDRADSIPLPDYEKQAIDDNKTQSDTNTSKQLDQKDIKDDTGKDVLDQTLRGYKEYDSESVKTASVRSRANLNISEKEVEYITARSGREESSSVQKAPVIAAAPKVYSNEADIKSRLKSNLQRQQVNNDNMPTIYSSSGNNSTVPRSNATHHTALSISTFKPNNTTPHIRNTSINAVPVAVPTPEIAVTTSVSPKPIETVVTTISNNTTAYETTSEFIQQNAQATVLLTNSDTLKNLPQDVIATDRVQVLSSIPAPDYPLEEDRKSIESEEIESDTEAHNNPPPEFANERKLSTYSTPRKNSAAPPPPPPGPPPPAIPTSPKIVIPKSPDSPAAQSPFTPAKDHNSELLKKVELRRQKLEEGLNPKVDIESKLENKRGQSVMINARGSPNSSPVKKQAPPPPAAKPVVLRPKSQVVQPQTTQIQPRNDRPMNGNAQSFTSKAELLRQQYVEKKRQSSLENVAPPPPANFNDDSKLTQSSSTSALTPTSSTSRFFIGTNSEGTLERRDT